MSDYIEVYLSPYTIELLKQFRLNYYQLTGDWLVSWNDVIRVMCTTIKGNNIL